MTKEEAKNILEKFIKGCEGDDFNLLMTLNDEEIFDAIKVGINSLSVLPSNLDEAAEEYADYNSQRWHEDGDVYYDHSKIVDAFKAGAEWMARQGYTVDGIVICDKELTRGYKDIVMSIPDELKVDDKVTIQIRKRQ